MYSHIERFIEDWQSLFSRSDKFCLCLHYLVSRHQEEVGYRDFLRRPIWEIERILSVYVKLVQIRKMVIKATVAQSEAAKGLKNFSIYIKNDDTFMSQLESLVHEILHVHLYQYGIRHADEERLEEIAVKVARRNRRKIEQIFLREAVVASTT